MQAPSTNRSKALTALGTVVAPTTLLTALLFYFGQLHVTGYFRVFGIGSTALDLTATDYFVRSADGLFVPVAVGAAILLVAVVINRDLLARLGIDRRRAVRRVLAVIAALAGIVLVAAAAFGIADPSRYAAAAEFPGLGLTVGVLLLAYVVTTLRSLSGNQTRAQRGTAVAEWAGVFVLVSVGLFWAVGNYALQVGKGRAADTIAALPTTAKVTLYSDTALHLSGPEVVETACGADDDRSYRTTGLTLILTTAQVYFLLPGAWTPDTGGALILPKSDSIRLRFDPAGLSPSGPC